MRAVVLAYHHMGCVGIESLLRSGVDIAAVVTHTDNPNENIWFDSVAQLAASRGIPVFAPEDINHPLWVERIRRLAPDIIFSFYYRNMIKPAVLEIPPKGCLNLHGSLLPRYRGRCPVNWVILHGETETGVTLHYMTPKPDDGDIVAQTRVEIADDDTARTLFNRMTDAAGRLLDETLPKIIDGTAPRTPQDHANATYFGGRTPADGEIDWSAPAADIRNLVRAVTLPYPGAFTHFGTTKCVVWAAAAEKAGRSHAAPGTVASTDPLVVACGRGTLRIEYGQTESGVYTTGPQLAAELGLVKGARLGPDALETVRTRAVTRVLILGVNGFIGNALSERLLEAGGYEVHGMDLQSDKIERLLGEPRFHFDEGDISIHREWIEHHVKKCDVVVPLVAIATPIEYTRNPLRVFELDFEENLRVVRYCVKYGRRLVFPSTSEVYGMCADDEFDENTSNFVLGPIHMQRWIYSCIKQMLDRVIWAYGQQKGLRFSLFRPFNWIGPRLDSLDSARIGSSRAITQLILNLVEGSPINLVDGGLQRRCFTHVADGVECLFRIIQNTGGVCDRQIFNIGNPDNDASISDLAHLLVDRFEKHPLRSNFPPFAGFREIESGRYYGAGYQDMANRTPSIRNARRLLGWKPSRGLDEAVEETLDFFLREAIEAALPLSAAE